MSTSIHTRISLTLQTFILVTLGVLIISCGNNSAAKEQKKTATTKVETESSPNQAKTDTKYILFFGNSLSAGYGLDEEFSFPSVIQDKIDQLDLDYTVVNAGLSGETTAGGLNRISWVLNQEVDIFILELGGNDMLRGQPVDLAAQNLKGIVAAVREKYPDIPIILAGMQAAPNLGEDYVKAFDNMYPTLAKEMDLKLIPSLLKDVGGIKSLNQPDGIHPNEEGAKIVAENVWKVLGPLITK